MVSTRLTPELQSTASPHVSPQAPHPLDPVARQLAFHVEPNRGVAVGFTSAMNSEGKTTVWY